MSKPLRGRALWEKLIAEQEAWLAEHGGDLAGYIANYHGRHHRTVANATAIWEADAAALANYRERLARYTAREPRQLGACYAT